MNTTNLTDNIRVYVRLANSAHFNLLRSLQRHKTQSSILEVV